MKIAIITVNYNNPQDTVEFLSSLEGIHPCGHDTITVVVDNGSTDDSVKQILKAHPRIDLVQTEVNLGFTGGYNRGIEYSLAWGADAVLIINNDTLIKDRKIVQNLAQTLKIDKNIGIVAPKILFAPGYEFHKDRYTEKDKGKVVWYGGGTFDWDNIYSKHTGINEVDSGQYDHIKEVEFASGCCLLIKREVFERVGMFNSKLFAYFEDNDLLYKAKKHGFKLFYNGETSIYHKVSQTSGVGSKIADYFTTRNRLYFGMQYGKLRTKFALLREAHWQLIKGREYQKKGVLDYFHGRSGGLPELEKIPENPGYQVEVSVVIVNYNTPDLIEKLLESLYKRNSGLKNYSNEVVVLDNGSEFDCDNEIFKFPQVKYLKNDVNTGFSKGYNRALQFSRGKYLLLLNSDMEAMDNCISKLVEKAKELKKDVILGGQLQFPNGKIQDSAFYLPTFWGAIKEYFLRIKGSYFMYTPGVDNTSQVEGLVMACFLISRRIINRMGYLDEGTFLYFEDVEYCRRAKRFNIPVLYYPEAKFIHHHGASSKKIKSKGGSYELLKKASVWYHGRFKYSLLYIVLWLAGKFSRVNPGDRTDEDDKGAV